MDYLCELTPCCHALFTTLKVALNHEGKKRTNALFCSHFYDLRLDCKANQLKESINNFLRICATLRRFALLTLQTMLPVRKAFSCWHCATRLPPAEESQAVTK